MGCKAQTTDTLTIHNFSLDKLYDEDYTLQQIHNIFTQLTKNHKTLDQKHASLLEEIHDYLEENYYKCYICGDYFEDHEYINENATHQDCYSCFTEFDSY